MCIPLLPHFCYMPRQSHPSWLDHSNYTNYLHSTNCSTITPSSIIWGWYNRPVVASVRSGRSLIPLRIIIIKNSLSVANLRPETRNLGPSEHEVKGITIQSQSPVFSVCRASEWCEWPKQTAVLSYFQYDNLFGAFSSKPALFNPLKTEFLNKFI
jgi:hypothetical protein